MNKSTKVFVLALLFSTISVGVFAQAKKGAFAPIEDEPDLPRVLIIGDSISIGYTLPVRKALTGKANVHRAPTNCGPTTRGLEQLDQWLGDGKWDVIHFNWGLHDLKYIDGKHQVPLDEYEKNLRTLTDKLKKTDATLIWCSTTPVPNTNVNPKRVPQEVGQFNAVAAKIMNEQEVAVDDLYSFALQRLEKIQRKDNVHFSPEGSNILGQEVARQIEAHLSK